MKPAEEEDPGYEYESTVDGALAIIRAYNNLTFLDRMKPLMTEVARELVRRGVDFSKVQYDEENDR
jgi:hypothetical protein